jgi:hypothetical protein
MTQVMRHSPFLLLQLFTLESEMRKLTLLLSLVGLVVAVAAAQKKYKPWIEWNDKDAQKILNDSPWGQTQAETNTAEMFFSPTSGSGGGGRANTGGATGSTNDRNAQGAVNQSVNINFRIRFLSARPVRQAFARRLILQNPQAEAQLKTFAEQRSADWVVVAVDFDSTDQRFTNKAMQAFNAMNMGTLANFTYLERKDGKRIFIKDYKAPSGDGMGAKFIFPRKLEGEDTPFVNADSGYLRFYSEVGTAKEYKLNMRFKVNEMLYDGNFEF